MPFKKRCASEALHEQWGVEDSPLTSRVPTMLKRKLLELANKDELVHYTKSPPKFCQQCIIKATELYPELETAKEASSSHCSTMDAEVIETELPGKRMRIDLPVSDIEEEGQLKIAYDLGNLQKDKCRSYAFRTSMDKDLNTLLSFDARDCHGESANIVHAFISGLTNQPFQSSETEESFSSYLQRSGQHKKYQMCKTVESILNLSAVNLNLPAHFRESVILYTLTGSRLALQMLGSGGAHASYQAVKAWLASLASTPPEVPEGDIVVGFDNNQVLQRRWKVKLRNEVKCNIVTIVVSFLIRKNGNLEYQAHLKPGTWLKNMVSDTDMRKIKYIDQDEGVKKTHYEHLYLFVHKQIQAVAAEQRRNEQFVFTDIIDEHVARQEKALVYKTCYNCLYEEVPKSKHVCPKCKANVTKAKMKSLGLDESGNAAESSSESTKEASEYRLSVGEKRGERWQHGVYHQKANIETESKEYEHISALNPEKPSVHVLEPVYVNPCSYDAVTTVLRNIGQKMGISASDGSGQWVIVVCDGVPYTLCHRIISCMYLCLKCQEPIEGKLGCEKHFMENHPGEDLIFKKEFDWVLLQPGAGHIEMNMVKGIVELGWEVFWKNLAFCLNFRSEMALSCAKKVTDHHKGWTMCRIAREALTKELVVPFVRQELSKDQPKLDAAEYFKYVMMAGDPNYTFIADFVFELLDAVFMYRDGVRCHVPAFIEAGRGKFAKLWCGRHHPLYRELEMADTICQHRMPKEVHLLVQIATSLNLSENPNKGEGADFRLEEVNRQIQKWLPNVPSTKDWQIACSNFDQLNILRRTVFEQMGVKDPKCHDSRYTQNIDVEVAAFRAELRKREYLLHPKEEKEHVSLDGKELDQDLKTFCQLAREKRAKYMDTFLLHAAVCENQKPGPPKFKDHPVFITVEERKQFLAVENQTMMNIKAIVKEDIEKLTDHDVREVMQTTWAEILSNKPKKASLLEFYYELQEYIDVQNVEQEEESDGED